MSVSDNATSVREWVITFDKPVTDEQHEIFLSMNAAGLLSNQLRELQEQYRSSGGFSFDEQNRLHYLVKGWLWNYDLDILITPSKKDQ